VTNSNFALFIFSAERWRFGLWAENQEKNEGNELSSPAHYRNP
jgi:hypothetical protein